jgi:hypothetical protein
VRSLNSPVLRWPDRQAVADAVRRWALEETELHPGTLAIGYFGSYATGTWGVGSDIDLVAVVESSDAPFETRSLSWDTTTLPVPAQLLVYTTSEWHDVLARRDRFAGVLTNNVIWVVGQPPAAPQGGGRRGGGGR